MNKFITYNYFGAMMQTWEIDENFKFKGLNNYYLPYENHSGTDYDDYDDYENFRIIHDIEILKSKLDNKIYLAVISNKPLIDIYNLYDGDYVKEIKKKKERYGHKIKQISDTEIIKYGNRSNIYNILTCLESKSFNIKLCKEVISCVDYMANEFLICGIGNKIKIFFLDGSTKEITNAHFHPIKCLKIYNKEKIITGSNDHTIKVWCLNTNLCILTLFGHMDIVIKIEIISENKLASVSKDNTVKIWCLLSEKCIKTFSFESEYLMDMDMDII